MITLEINQLITLITVLAIAAAASGFIAGLLGVGGGILMVPALYYAFSTLNFDENIIMHLSLGTSLAIIIPTSIMSAKTHYKFKAVNFGLIKSFGLPVVIGIFIGTFMATHLRTVQLLLMFSIFSFCVGLFFIFIREKMGEKPKSVGTFIKSITGAFMGFMSVPLGIGGGSLGVPFMRLFGYPIREAIGTSAAIGFIISLFGASSMAFSGLMFSDFSAPLSVGYVNIPGFLVFVPVTMTMAPIGARLVHSIDKNLLSKTFGAFLIIISIRAFIEFLNF